MREHRPELRVRAAWVSRTGWLIAGLLGCLVLSTSLFAGVFSGQVTAVGGGKITLQNSTKSQTFTIPKEAALLLDDKKCQLQDLAEGLQASVFTDASNAVTRISARTASAKPAPSKPEDTDEPKSTGSKKPITKNPRSKSTEDGAEGPWPQFLGPNRDNISRETGLKTSWGQNGPG